MDAAAAAAWAAIAAASLLIGCALTLWLRPSDRVVGLVMGFGAGALISATSYELVLEAIESHGPVVLGLTAGALTFFVADAVIDRRGGADRKRIVGETAAGGSGMAIFLGTLVDGIPESLVLGMSLALGGSVSTAFLAAVFVSNLPEAVAATGALHAAGWERRRLFELWGWVVLSAAVSGALGYVLVANVSGLDGSFAQAFAAGGVLTMLADTMMPEALEHGGRTVGLVTVLGFIVATTISALD
jgi:ZIP family zinc transporter